MTTTWYPDNPPAAANDCDHYWASHVRGGEPVAVRICRLCSAIDWEDLRAEIQRVVDAIDRTGDPWWAVNHPGIGVLVYDDEGQARIAAGTAGTLLTRDTPDQPWRPA